jgi:hypothetical protein
MTSPCCLARAAHTLHGAAHVAQSSRAIFDNDAYLHPATAHIRCVRVCTPFLPLSCSLPHTPTPPPTPQLANSLSPACQGRPCPSCTFTNHDALVECEVCGEALHGAGAGAGRRGDSGSAVARAGPGGHGNLGRSARGDHDDDDDDVVELLDSEDDDEAEVVMHAPRPASGGAAVPVRGARVDRARGAMGARDGGSSSVRGDGVDFSSTRHANLSACSVVGSLGTVVAVDNCAGLGHRSLWVRGRIRCCRGAPCVRGEGSPVSPLSRRLTSAAVNMLFPAVSGSPSSDNLVWTCALCREENFRDARVRLRVGSCVLCTVLHVPPARIVSVMRRTPCLFAPVQVCGWCGEAPASPHSSQGPSPGARAYAGASAGARVGVRVESASGSAQSPRLDPHSGGPSSRARGGADGVAAVAGLGALSAPFCLPSPPTLVIPVLLHPHAFVYKAALSLCTLPFISSPPSSTTTLPLPYNHTTPNHRNQHPPNCTPSPHPPCAPHPHTASTSAVSTTATPSAGAT